MCELTTDMDNTVGIDCGSWGWGMGGEGQMGKNMDNSKWKTILNGLIRQGKKQDLL